MLVLLIFVFILSVIFLEFEVYNTAGLAIVPVAVIVGIEN